MVALSGWALFFFLKNRFPHRPQGKGRLNACPLRGVKRRATESVDVGSYTPQQSVSVEPAGAISDHALVTCRLPVVDHSSTVIERIVRGWRAVDRDEIRRLLENSDLGRPVSADCDVNQLFDTYESVLRNVADRLAPPHTVRRSLSVWLRGLIMNAKVAAENGRTAVTDQASIHPS